MGKGHLTSDLKPSPLRNAPHGADHVAEPVDAEDGCPIEPRDVVATSDVCEVMLDEVRLRFHVSSRYAQSARKRFLRVQDLSEVCRALRGDPTAGAVSQSVADPLAQVGPRITRQREVVDVSRREARNVEAVSDRAMRERRIVFDAREALLFDSRE